MLCIVARELIAAHPGSIAHKDLVERMITFSRADCGPSRASVSNALSNLRKRIREIGLDLEYIHGSRRGGKVGIVIKGEQ